MLQPARRAPRDQRDRAPALHPARAHAVAGAWPRPTTRSARSSASRACKRTARGSVMPATAAAADRTGHRGTAGQGAAGPGAGLLRRRRRRPGQARHRGRTRRRASRCTRRAAWPCCCPASPSSSPNSSPKCSARTSTSRSTPTASRPRRCRASRRRPASTGPRWSAPPTPRASASCTARSSPARAPPTLLPEILREAIAAMPIPKPMRWGDARLRLRAAGALAGAAARRGRRRRRGARRDGRPHEPRPSLPCTTSRCGSATPDDYVDALRAANVLVDPDERRARIVARGRTRRRARPAACARIDAGNLEQVNCLVEWPSAVAVQLRARVPARCRRKR